MRGLALVELNCLGGGGGRQSKRCAQAVDVERRGQASPPVSASGRREISNERELNRARNRPLQMLIATAQLKSLDGGPTTLLTPEGTESFRSY